MASVGPAADKSRDLDRHVCERRFQVPPTATHPTVGWVSAGYRTLLLLRHAKSDYPGGVVDHERPLAPRGEREAGLAGDWLRANAPAVDAVLCSTATRTRQTLQRTRIDAPVEFVDRLYDATPGAVIDEVNGVGSRFDADIATLLVIGHEPAMSAVALGLATADWQQFHCRPANLDEVSDVGHCRAAHRRAMGSADSQRRRTGHVPRAPLGVRSWSRASTPSA